MADPIGEIVVTGITNEELALRLKTTPAPVGNPPDPQVPTEPTGEIGYITTENGATDVTDVQGYGTETAAVSAGDVKYSAADLDAIAANAGVDTGEGGVISVWGIILYRGFYFGMYDTAAGFGLLKYGIFLKYCIA